jgi:murein DD-endopeptidase MepM/ murein hydrolase activator NlpD
MRCVDALPRPLPWFRLTLVAEIALGVVGCSSDFSRLSDNRSESNGSRPSSDVTGSVQPRSAAPINSTTLPPPPSQQPANVTSSNTPAPRIATNTPASGTQSSNAPVKPATTQTLPAAGAGPVHVVVSGETLHKISRQYRVTLTELASANNISTNAKLKLGDRLVIPGARAAQSSESSPPPKMLAKSRTSPTPPANNTRMIAPAPEVGAENKNLAAPASLTFRWPVRGRVIAGFGPKPSGQQNDGINFAVPEGTPIKAAEDGVVAYAGNELKTYGNLVLIRHANGFVTAYAHASEILVKRDEPVKRGQVIAKSGQTGNVATPQLHFEIRKGASPVDPMPYLDRSPQA